MQRPNQSHLRINLAELKAQLAKRLGPDRSKLYFHYLNKLLGLKLSKVEFNKFCLRVIGRENVKLHNKLIHSILENACKANVPPLASTQDENGFEITSGEYDEQNGEVLLSSPVGSRSGITVGSDGDFSVDSSSQQSEVLFVGDGKEPFTRSTIQPPLGIPFCSDSVGGARGGRCYSSYDSGRLLDTEMLKERMQEIVVAHGLEGVSVDCASLLNNGLHVYLKRLIKSSVELVGIRSGHDLMGSNVHKHHSYVKPVNGGFPGYDFHISLPDFKVAMGLKPQQLGEDWPLLLERICTCSHVE